MALTTRAILDTHMGDNAAIQFSQEARDWACLAASAAIEKWCDAEFEDAQETGWMHTQSGARFYPSRRPVMAVYQCYTGYQDCLRVKCTDTGAVSAMATVSQGVLILHFTGMSQYKQAEEDTGSTTQTLTLASYKTISDLSTAINLLDGWEATILSVEWLPRDIRPVFGQRADTDIGATLSVPDPTTAISAKPSRDGNSIIPETSFGEWTFLHFRSGYTTIPQDLERIATTIAKDILFQSNRDDMLSGDRLAEVSTYTTLRFREICAAFKQDLARWSRRVF